jgi:hypothetical protein
VAFWIATADLDGLRITDSELELQPAPTRVEYPQDPTGEITATDDGRVVQQQTSRDGRLRTWTWAGYPADQSGFKRVWSVLESLRSRYRRELGLSPFVFVKEDVSGGLRVSASLTGSASGSGTALTMAGLPAGITEGFVTLAGQSRAILSSTSGAAVVADAFTGTPSDEAAVQYWVRDWVRVRVLQVSREPSTDGRSVRYDAKIVFTIDDNSWDAIG